MDVIVEGKITAEEGIDEVLQTIVDLKYLAQPVLRINCLDKHIQGKIGFSQGGYILGGKVDETGETGYAAVRTLLSVTAGNYAILDPQRQHFPEINQTLWIAAAKVIKAWPNLPESPDSLLDANPNVLSTVAPTKRVDTGVQSASQKPQENITFRATSSKARRFGTSSTSPSGRITTILWMISLIFLAAIIAAHANEIWWHLKTWIK